MFHVQCSFGVMGRDKECKRAAIKNEKIDKATNSERKKGLLKLNIEWNGKGEAESMFEK